MGLVIATMLIETSGSLMSVAPNENIIRWAPSGIDSVTASKLKIGDKLARPYKIEHGKRQDIPIDICWLLGYTAGDGNNSARRLQWSEQDIGIVREIQRIGRESFSEIVGATLRKSQKGWLVYSRTDGAMQLLLCEYPEAVVTGSNLRSAPKAIFEQDAERVAAFISGVFDSDGSVSKQQLISIGVVSQQLRDSVFQLLLRFGITASCGIYVPKPPRQTVWRLSLAADNAKKFSSLIRFRMECKQRKAEMIPGRKVSGKRGRSVDSIPICLEMLRQLGFSPVKHNGGVRLRNGSLDRWHLEKIADSMEASGLNVALIRVWLSYAWAKVKHIGSP